MIIDKAAIATASKFEGRDDIGEIMVRNACQPLEEALIARGFERTAHGLRKIIARNEGREWATWFCREWEVGLVAGKMIKG